MMQVELLLRLVERQFKIIIVKLWVDDIVPSVAQKRRLHAPWNGHPTMKEQYFHKASRLRRVFTQIGTEKNALPKTIRQSAFKQPSERPTQLRLLLELKRINRVSVQILNRFVDGIGV